MLGLKSLRITPPFDGRWFIYRTGEFSFERDSYAEFLDSPGKDLMVPVYGMLREQNCFSAVVDPGSTVKPDALVEITIDQLFGDIRRPKSPRAVLAMQVTFLDAANGLSGKVILQRNYSRSVPMNSTSPSALMEGWNQALAGILAEAASDLQSRGIEGHGDDRNGGSLLQKSSDKP
ncbi:MAG: ABC-type transport auxiliary lipoprotein family protein [Limisphaerales bacterium]